MERLLFRERKMVDSYRWVGVWMDSGIRWTVKSLRAPLEILVRCLVCRCKLWSVVPVLKSCKIAIVHWGRSVEARAARVSAGYPMPSCLVWKSHARLGMLVKPSSWCDLVQYLNLFAPHCCNAGLPGPLPKAPGCRFLVQRHTCRFLLGAPSPCDSDGCAGTVRACFCRVRFKLAHIGQMCASFLYPRQSGHSTMWTSWLEGWVGGWVSFLILMFMDGWMNGWMPAWMHAHMHGRMDRRTDGLVDWWTACFLARVRACGCACLFSCFLVCLFACLLACRLACLLAGFFDTTRRSAQSKNVWPRVT